MPLDGTVICKVSAQPNKDVYLVWGDIDSASAYGNRTLREQSAHSNASAIF